MDGGCEIISKLGSESIINSGSGFQYGNKTTSVSNGQLQSSKNVQILKVLFLRSWCLLFNMGGEFFEPWEKIG